MTHTSIQQEPQQKQMPADGIILNKTNSGHLQYVKSAATKTKCRPVHLFLNEAMSIWQLANKPQSKHYSNTNNR